MIEDERQDEFLDDAEQGQIFVAADLVEDSGLLAGEERGGGGARQFLGHAAGRNRAGRRGAAHPRWPSWARGDSEDVLEVEIVMHFFLS